MGSSSGWLLKHTEGSLHAQYVLKARVLMAPWGQNTYRSELSYKIVFDGYLFIPYFIVQNNGTHNLLRKQKLIF